MCGFDILPIMQIVNKDSIRGSRQAHKPQHQTSAMKRQNIIWTLAMVGALALGAAGADASAAGGRGLDVLCIYYPEWHVYPGGEAVFGRRDALQFSLMWANHVVVACEAKAER